MGMTSAMQRRIKSAENTASKAESKHNKITKEGAAALTAMAKAGLTEQQVRGLAKNIERKRRVAQVKDISSGKYDTEGMYKNSSYKSKANKAGFPLNVIRKGGDLLSQNNPRNAKSNYNRLNKSTPNDKAKKAALKRRMESRRLQRREI